MVIALRTDPDDVAFVSAFQTVFASAHHCVVLWRKNYDCQNKLWRKNYNCQNKLWRKNCNCQNESFLKWQLVAQSTLTAWMDGWIGQITCTAGCDYYSFVDGGDNQCSLWENFETEQIFVAHSVAQTFTFGEAFHKYFFNKVHLQPRFKHGAKLASCPGRHLTSLLGRHLTSYNGQLNNVV